MKICRLINSELEVYVQKCNFTNDELNVFWKLAKGKSIAEISLDLSVSESTVSRRIKEIENKMKGVRLLKERKVPIWEKLTLTVEEASDYSGIGINKLYELLSQPSSAEYVLQVGKRRIIKRKAFEAYLENSKGI